MRQRYLVVGITAIAALWMYIDRVSISIVADPIKTDLGLTNEEKNLALGAFYFTYALFQIPVGALADRFGPRLVLSLSIAAWSAATAATGLVGSFASFLGARLLLGATEAGAYPAAAALVKRWARPDERGLFSSVVAVGGRIGGASAPMLTGWLAIILVGVVAVEGANPSGKNWRGVFVLYGTLGLVVAALYWLCIRNHPPGGEKFRPPSGAPHPEHGHKDNAADTSEPHAPPTGPSPGEHTSPTMVVPPVRFIGRLGLLVSSRNMWLFGTLQFCNNVSWAFLVTLFPAYLKDAGVPFELQSDIQTGVLLTGCVGMICGGFVTDYARRRLGPRWGRSTPIATTMTGCAVMCAVVSSSPGLWVAVAALALMALFQDLGIPSVWAFAQDVGGRNVGAALGWGNMLGNFGASLSPWLLGEVQEAGGWRATFALCAACYVVAVVCGLLLDASKPVEPEQSGAK